MPSTSDPMFSESQITLTVPDMEEAVRFYTVTLGLHLKARYGNEFAVVEAPGLTIGLHPRPADGASRAPHLSIGLGVASLETSMGELSTRGVQFAGEILEDPPVRVAYFSGPAGEALYLLEQSGWR